MSVNVFKKTIKIIKMPKICHIIAYGADRPKKRSCYVDAE